MIKEDYVSLEIAKLLQEKGFDEDIRTWYTEDEQDLVNAYVLLSNTDFMANDEKNYSAPTMQMAFKWLREKKVYVSIFKFASENNWRYSIELGIPLRFYIGESTPFKTYEEAAEAALKVVLENL